MKNEVIVGDCAEVLKQFPDESIDAIVTDPPYGISFMGKEWDRALPSLEALKECNRVLKSGAFGFFMCAPRQDVLSRMIIRLEDAGFNVGFSSIFWAYAQGFAKSANVSKLIDKRFGVTREVIGKTTTGGCRTNEGWLCEKTEVDITIPSTDEAKFFDGAFCGFQPKPSTECVLVVMKPLDKSCKSYIDQALKNGKACTWLGECKIPYESDADKEGARFGTQHDITGGNYGATAACRPRAVIGKNILSSEVGRFPANLLVSDNILDRGIITKSKAGIRKNNSVLGVNTKDDTTTLGKGEAYSGCNDSGDFSRYFSLDAWWSKKLQELPPEQQKTFPFLITPKPSKSEKNRYIENKHPTVKPLKLMSYLITMGSREGDVILDPFAGSGTTLEACKLLNRVFIGIDKDPVNKPLMEARGQLNEVTLETFQEAKTV